MKYKLLSLVIINMLFVSGNTLADDFDYSIKVVNNTDTVITAQPFDNMGTAVCDPVNVTLPTRNSSQTCDAEPTFSGGMIGSFWTIGSNQNPQRPCPGIRLPNDLHGQIYTFTFEGNKTSGYSCRVVPQIK